MVENVCLQHLLEHRDQEYHFLHLLWPLETGKIPSFSVIVPKARLGRDASVEDGANLWMAVVE